MKAKTKLTKLWSFLLSLVMLFSLLPTTALAADNYSDSVRVYNANKKLIGLGDGECLTANDATGASSYTGGSSYVARYDQSSGTLYLKDYHGVAADGQIYAHGDLNIVVENDSSFTTSVSATNNLYGIQAGGKLNISGSGKLTVTANGDGDVYGIYADKGVTISAPLNVQVGKVDSSKNGPVYGIYTQSGAISLSDKDKTITATGGTSTVYGVFNAAETETPAIADNGNITISGTLTVNLSNGSYNRGISSQGGVITLDGATVKIPGSYYYGIFNKNGNVVIKSTSDVDISSDISGNNGICTYEGGDLTIENSIVSIRANGYAADLEKGKLSIKDSIVDLTRDYNHYSVVNTANDAANTIDLSGSSTVTLTASGNQSGSSMIGGTVTATSGTKLEKGTYYPDLKTYDGEYDATSDKTVLKFVHESAAPTTYTVSFDANGGTGTMADVTGVSGEYTLPANGFAAPADKQFKAWSVGGSEKAVGDKITITANTTVTAVWEAVEYNVTVTGGTASVGAGTPITKATMGTTVTLTAGAAPSGQMFDKWVVENGDITLADATSATTTFTMLAGEVSVKATYKDAPHTHTFDQKTIKDAALKTAADCTHDAVYYKSCSCGEISTNDADAFTATDSALGHDLVKTADAVNPTCVSVGWTAGYKCSRCDYEVRQEEVAKIAHTTKTTTTRATVSKDGKIVKTCTVCGKTVSTTVIPKISSIKLSATSYVYNGKVKTPSVIVKDRTGKTLVKNTDYTVSYASGRKYVGKYAVKVTFKGKYSGTKTLYFNVKPKSTSIASLSARSKGFYVKWNKQATQTTGYQIQYSTSSKFTKSKTVTISKNSTTSKTISKLTGKKKYYVRVRTYKTVKINGKATKIYSSWSKVKYVTTKA